MFAETVSISGEALLLGLLILVLAVAVAAVVAGLLVWAAYRLVVGRGAPGPSRTLLVTGAVAALASAFLWLPAPVLVAPAWGALAGWRVRSLANDHPTGPPPDMER